ncbi:hypothetical protein C1645_832290 [Glomus cerebriforme]|uniref:Uncharacterized protein n=1 Tax=Glomus cerebriforme TaxID=658196 RepID=A0A397SKA3_9GLOM|nr:hypothetical protein C1645_832290 [Glomus cerebriforme]
MVHRHTPPLFNIKVLESYVKDVWNDLPQEYYKNLINNALATLPADPYAHFSEEVLERKKSLESLLFSVRHTKFLRKSGQHNFQSPTSFSKVDTKRSFGILRYALCAQDGWVGLVAVLERWKDISFLGLVKTNAELVENLYSLVEKYFTSLGLNFSKLTIVFGFLVGDEEYPKID